MKQQILVISKDLIMCAEILKRMQNNLINICCITSAVMALASYIEQDYCLVILDIQYPDTNNLELLQMMLQVKHTPIMVLTESTNIEDTVTLLRSGADVCIEKPVNMDICEAQANALIQLFLNDDNNHKSYAPIIPSKELMIIPCCRQVIVEGEHLPLTRREFDLLRCFANSPGRVFTREQLYDLVWDGESAIAIDDIVRSQVKRLRKKLALVGKNYIQTEWGVGYKFVPSDNET